MKGDLHDLLGTLYARSCTVVYDVLYDGETEPTEVVRFHEVEGTWTLYQGSFENMRTCFIHHFTDDKPYDTVSVKKVYIHIIPRLTGKRRYEPSFHFICEYDYMNYRRSIQGDFNGTTISNISTFRDEEATTPRIFTDVGQVLNQLLTDLTILQTKKKVVYPLTLVHTSTSLTGENFSFVKRTKIAIDDIKEDQNVVETFFRHFREEHGDLTPDHIYLEYQTFNEVVEIRVQLKDGKLPETYNVRYVFADGVSEHVVYDQKSSIGDLSFLALKNEVEESLHHKLHPETEENEALVDA